MGESMILVIILLYFLPTMIAAARKHTNTGAIFILNTCFGWSIFGWVGALIWSVLK